MPGFATSRKPRAPGAGARKAGALPPSPWPNPPLCR